MVLLLLLFALIFLFWICLVFFATETKILTRTLPGVKRALVILPHPDDEALSCGGTIRHLQKQGASVTLAILTLGERGTKDGSASKILAQVRTKEMQQSAKILGVDKLVQEDFGDGVLAQKKPFLKKYVQNLLAETKPDLIITYDLSGLYGHPDHIALSEVVTKEYQVSWKKRSRLWYISFPEKFLKFITLPEHMAKDPAFRSHRKLPSCKVFVLPFMLAKLRAFWAHKSQHAGFRSSLPLRQIVPAEFFFSARIFEYFYEA